MGRSRSRKISAELGLSLAERDYLTAAVFDANCFGYGRPDLNYLEFLARRLAEVGIETWVPEPVAWEWAQHVADDWDAMRVRLGDEHRRVKKAGLSSFESPYGDVAEVADAFLVKLGELSNVTLVPLSSNNARQGLRDQILQLAPGRRKEGVKTGASDSAWLRDVLDRTERDVARLLFVSEDKDLRAALAAWGYAEPLTRPLKDLLATLFVVTVDSGAATQVLLRYLLDTLPAEQGANVFDVGEAPDLQSVVERIIDPPEESPRIDNVTISRVTKLAGIVSVTVEVTDRGQPQGADGGDGEPDVSKRGMYGQFEQKSPHTVQATVMLLADAEAAVSRYDADDRYVTTVTTVPDVLLRANMVFDLEAGVVVAVRPEGEVAAFGHHDAYDDENDAYFAVLEEIGDLVPGLEMSEKLAMSESFDEEINGRKVHVEYRAIDAGEWVLHVEIDEHEAELSCWYDVGARVWDGKDSFDMPGAYPMSVSISASSNPAWALSGWIIERLYG
ncbi:hypothetical protein GCM10009565_58800 [Amycolatopsis albidoflavus]|uniref:hypothetical protein n=1 Tax=Amycolatopsis albidoflavus TaxID=102226 RepID=UPI0031D2D515